MTAIIEISINNIPNDVLRQEGYKLLSTIQMAFLKAGLIKQEAGFDFYNKSLDEYKPLSLPSGFLINF